MVTLPNIFKNQSDLCMT